MVEAGVTAPNRTTERRSTNPSVQYLSASRCSDLGRAVLDVSLVAAAGRGSHGPRRSAPTPTPWTANAGTARWLCFAKAASWPRCRCVRCRPSLNSAVGDGIDEQIVFDYAGQQRGFASLRVGSLGARMLATGRATPPAAHVRHGRTMSTAKSVPVPALGSCTPSGLVHS